MDLGFDSARFLGKTRGRQKKDTIRKGESPKNGEFSGFHDEPIVVEHLG